MSTTTQDLSQEESSIEIDPLRLIAAGLPRGSAPRQIKAWIEEQGWEATKISRVPCQGSDAYAVRFDTHGDDHYNVTQKVIHGMPSSMGKRIFTGVEAPRPILHGKQMFTHVYVRI